MSSLESHFAPAERLPDAEVFRQSEVFRQGAVREVLDALPVSVLVLNEQRQTVFCNAVFVRFAGCGDGSVVLGKRPGEALGCVHADEMEAGCGTSLFCRYCGAAQAILACLRGHPGAEECRITRSVGEDEDSLDLQVFTSPLSVEGHSYVQFCVLDIRHEKRLAALERVFFHDVLNSLTGIGYAAHMAAAEVSPRRQLERLSQMADFVVEEVRGHRMLFDAERSELALSLAVVEARRLLEEVRLLYATSPSAEGKFVRISCPDDLVFLSDPVLLRRVLGNLLKNALEAVRSGQTVEMGCRTAGDEAECYVTNPSLLDEAARRQVFQRSYSTKGAGRGLGTYGAKLLTERFLRGRIEFTSSEADGTTFRVFFPLKGPLAGE